MADDPVKLKLLKLLEKVFLRRAVLKEYEKATDALIAQLQQKMGEEGYSALEGVNGGSAKTGSTSSTKMPSDLSVVLKNFDARTMAALLAGSTVTAAKQNFLSRACASRDFSTVFQHHRSDKFTINLPRSKEQVDMMVKAIKADEAAMDKKVENLLSLYEQTESIEVLPDNPMVDAVLSEDAKQAKAKAAKKKAPKKKK